MFLSRDVSFQAEDTVDRGSVSVPWSHLPMIKHMLTPALQPASQPKGALESPSATPTNMATAAQAYELRRACCGWELQRGRSQKVTLVSSLFFRAPSSRYLEKTLPRRQGRKLPSSPQCFLQAETNAGQEG